MSSIIRLGPGRGAGPLGVPADGHDVTIIGPEMRSVRFPAGIVLRVGGAGTDGLEIHDKEVAANSRCIIYLPVAIQPRKYETVISYNPELLKFGTVSAPPMLTPGRGADIFLGFQAAKKTNLDTDFEYIFEIFMID